VDLTGKSLGKKANRCGLWILQNLTVNNWDITTKKMILPLKLGIEQ
jgi:hypothetical protein